MQLQKNPPSMLDEDSFAQTLSDNDLMFKDIQYTEPGPTPSDLERFIPFQGVINDDTLPVPETQKEDMSNSLTNHSDTKEKPEKTREETTSVFIISCFFWVLVCLLVSLVIFLVIFTFSYSKKNINTFQFEGYSVIVDLDNSVPISSTMKLKKSGSITPSKSCSRFDNIAGFSITTDDYKTITQTPFPSGTEDKYDRGHLSPFADIGDPSCKIVNVVPQLRCHNQEVWQHFETYIRDKLPAGEEIVTFPVYNFTSFAPTEHGPLYIPYKICKRIKNVNYCIPHHSGVCSKPWKDVIQPKFPY